MMFTKFVEETITSTAIAGIEHTAKRKLQHLKESATERVSSQDEIYFNCRSKLAISGTLPLEAARPASRCQL